MKRYLKLILPALFLLVTANVFVCAYQESFIQDKEQANQLKDDLTQLKEKSEIASNNYEKDYQKLLELFSEQSYKRIRNLIISNLGNTVHLDKNVDYLRHLGRNESGYIAYVPYKTNLYDVKAIENLTLHFWVTKWPKDDYTETRFALWSIANYGYTPSDRKKLFSRIIDYCKEGDLTYDYTPALMFQLEDLPKTLSVLSVTDKEKDEATDAIYKFITIPYEYKLHIPPADDPKGIHEACDIIKKFNTAYSKEKYKDCKALEKKVLERNQNN